MSSRSRGSSQWLLAPILVLSLCRGTSQIAKNFVNSSTPDLRPTFVVNFDTSTVICQHSADPTDLHIHNMSSLCDGKQDCFVNPAMHDEVFPYCEHKCASTCSGNGACLYDGSKPQCYCDSGYSGTACELQDKNECLEHPCHMMAQCQNTLGSYECRCLPGYQGDGHECHDIDECSQATRCPEHSACINLPGTYYCNCTQGFSPKGNQGSGLDKCADINECESGAHNCGEHEICENTIGSFKCVTKCSPGYQLIGGKCEDVDECQSKELHKCDVRAECVNTVGGYECECEEGFDGDGKNCQPKSSCRKNSAICDRHASCNILLDMCVCKTGYTGDGITCHDVDECDAKEKPCVDGGRCLNLDGGYVCCKAGQDDGECVKEQGAFCSGGCGDNAICSNATCQCIGGFSGDPHKKCVDVNECVENDSICGGVGDRCVNLFGGYKCCQHGSTDPECLNDQAFSSDSSTLSSHGADFTTTGEQFVESSGSIRTASGGSITVTRGVIPKDVELTTSGRLACTSYCPPNSECVGGYCECVKGYGGNALVGCEDVDECITETCNEEANEWCVNLIGGFVCCNPTNATHDDCIGLEITKEKGLHVIGGNEEDTVVAARSNHSTSDQLITQVVQQSRNFSSGQIILTRGKVSTGQPLIQTTDSEQFGLEISAADLLGSGSGATPTTTLEPISGSGKTGVWTEDEDGGEDDDLMEEGGSGSWSTTINGTGFTGAPRSEGTIRVRITTLGEDGVVETATKAGVTMPDVKKGMNEEGEGRLTVETDGEESASVGKNAKVTVEGSGASETESSGKGSGDLEKDTGSAGSSKTTVEGSGSSGSSTTFETGSSGSSTSTGEGSGSSGSAKPSGKDSGSSESPKPSKETEEETGSSGSSTISETGSSGSSTTFETGSSGSSISTGKGSGSAGAAKPSEEGSGSAKPSGKDSGSSESPKPSKEGSGSLTSTGEGSGSAGSAKPSEEGSGASGSSATTETGTSGSSTSAGEGSGSAIPSGKDSESSGPSKTAGEGSGTSKSAKPAEEGSGTSETSKPSGEQPGSSESTKPSEEGSGSAGSSKPSEKESGSSESPKPSKEESGASGSSTPAGEGSTTAKPSVKGSGITGTTPSSGNSAVEGSGETGTTPLSREPSVEGSGSTTPTVEGSGTTAEPEGSGEWVETGSKGHFESGTKVTKVTKSDKPDVVTDGEDSSSTSSGDEKVPKSDSKGEKPTTDDKDHKVDKKNKKDGSSEEVGIEITNKERSNEVGLEISAGKKEKEEVGLEIVWESTTTSEPTPDSDNVGLEISGTDLAKTTKQPIEGSGTGDEEITATTRDIFKSTKRPPGIEIDGGDEQEQTGVDGKDGKGTTPAPTIAPATVQHREEFKTTTKDTFALPTTTQKPVNETVENSKCTSSDECGMDALCERRTGVCRCEPGFEGAPPKRTCVDVDECATGDHKCHPTARCQNFIGGYACFCPTGFRKTDDGSCEDIDECHEHKSTCCGGNATCVNKPGTYACECDTGFLGDGYQCVPNTKKPCDAEQVQRSHCAESNMACQVETSTGAVECSACMSGYKKSGTMCEDVNECEAVESPCSPNAGCVNLNGTFSCACKPGFRGDGFMCEDINECDERHPCHPHAECTNQPGSFQCQCHAGFEGDGIKKCTNPLERSCEDVEKFCGRVEHVSCLSVRIYNGSLSSVCECEPGFRLDPASNQCKDIDECDENRHNCDPASSVCINTEGSFKCECAEGYEGEGGVCTDIDECDRGMAGCDSMAMCYNRMGSCGCKCMAGYTGDGAHCTKITEPPKSDKTQCTDEWSRLCELEKKQCTVDEEEVPQCGACLPGHHPINGTCQSLQISGLCAHKNDCNEHAECIDILPDSHFCSCPDGFIGDGMMCDDVDECTNSGMCEGAHVQCENTIGSFKCVCEQGFRKEGDACVPGKIEIDEEGNGTDANSGSQKPAGTSKAPSSEAPETSTTPTEETTTPSSSTSSESTTSSSGPKESEKPTPPPTTSTTAAAPLTGKRGPPSIQPPVELFTSPPSNGGYGEETNEEVVETTTTTAAPSLCANTKCHLLAECEPTTGTCVCHDGLIGDGTTICAKKSEADCTSLPALCAENARCDNSTRSCECLAGYIGDGYVCSPHPQDCVLRDNLCSPEAICQNRRCQCLPGFTGDGIKCVSIHERASNCSQCDANAHCVGGTTCKCNNGYFGNGLCCVPDPLDCVHFTGICHPNAVCNQDSRQCECSSGFSGNGVSCFPQKSCRTDRSVCATNAICLPTGNCICRHGFKGDPFYKCTSIVSKEPARTDLSDVSSCVTPCDAASQLCIGGECVCKPGFRAGSGSTSCADIDECAELTHSCDRVATCRNTFGSHVCTCPAGHVGDGTTCVPHVNHGKLSVYCEADGMTLVLGNETADFEGKIFVKGQAENPHCSKTFSSLLNSHKPYVFKVAFQHCDVQLLDNHTMASTVVVQKHAMFLTNKADSYDLRCQYPIGSRAVESHVNVSELATTSTLTDRNSMLAPVCRLSVSNEQQVSISSATVGDTLKLALEVTPSDNFGILPRNCFAVNIETGERYTLTDDTGCAIDESLFPQWSVATSSRVQAVFRTFKWPDSSMIRFQCDCQPCVGQCATPSCISTARFRRHHSPIVMSDEIRQEMVLMSGVESLAVSSIINVHDTSDMSSSSSPEDVVALLDDSTPSICVRMAPLFIALASFVACAVILVYLCSRKPKTVDCDSEIQF